MATGWKKLREPTYLFWIKKAVPKMHGSKMRGIKDERQRSSPRTAPNRRGGEFSDALPQPTRRGQMIATC